MATITRDENLRSGLAGYAVFFKQHRKEAESLISDSNLQKRIVASELLDRDKKIDPNEINYSGKL
ncbi:MAG: hypothetical protein PVG30_07690 [Gammaproteobacteria bacterium]